MLKLPLAAEGKELEKFPVRISYRIIQLFSEGLYSSPNKAVEELVTNAFDAGAVNVHVVLSPDLKSEDATIAVLDDGSGMSESDLKDHWWIGHSNKRSGDGGKRRPIGKFGIGKLATYVLASRLTHVTKRGGRYFATSMDFSEIPVGDGGVFETEQVLVPLRELNEVQAKNLLRPWTEGVGPGYRALRLFGNRAKPSWTVAVMSGLKVMTEQITRGRLTRVLSTAMPLRDDFKLYLDGKRVPAARESASRQGSWIIGKDVSKLPKPAPSELEVTEDQQVPEGSVGRFGLTHPRLGRITGYVELFDEPLTTGKAFKWERSHGFFIYVLGRLINLEDEYFGIDSNLLRHGTFSRFRAVVNMDQLDEELRSSRENVREGDLYYLARDVLQSLFNFARAEQLRNELALDGRSQLAQRYGSTPASLVRTPIVSLAERIARGKASSRYLRLPTTATGTGIDGFLTDLQRQSESSEGLVTRAVVERVTPTGPMAVLDLADFTLRINSLHPFVAHFLDEYEDRKQSIPLELLALSEVLMEAFLFSMGLAPDVVNDVLAEREELLRFLARSPSKRNALQVAQAVLDAANDRTALQRELIAAFESMGFDTVPLGGPKVADGLATASLAATLERAPRIYKVSLEAKSKADPKKKVRNEDARVSTVARHRDDLDATHAVIVGQDFQAGSEEAKEVAALIQEIRRERDAWEKREADENGVKPEVRTITLMRTRELADLVRLVPLRRVGLNKLKDLFATCVSPDEVADWIEGVSKETSSKPPYKDILETIQLLQTDAPLEVVEFGSLQTALRITRQIVLDKPILVELCQALSRIVPNYVAVRENSVEIYTKPEIILSAIDSTVRGYALEERIGLNL
ncbi:MAG TPA: ATP-binding protein [Fimbriimonadaceae bacterium]|nr:ATP-binding protein [Fimbriimonadaceae bacterium]